MATDNALYLDYLKLFVAAHNSAPRLSASTCSQTRSHQIRLCSAPDTLRHRAVHTKSYSLWAFQSHWVSYDTKRKGGRPESPNGLSTCAPPSRQISYRLAWIAPGNGQPRLQRCRRFNRITAPAISSLESGEQDFGTSEAKWRPLVNS